MIDRRGQLGLGSAAAAAPFGFAGAAGARVPRIQRTVTLGRTGLEVSEISFGAASSHDPKLVRYALERGVTFCDTAESYRFSWSEEALGEGLKGARDRIVLSSKTKAPAGERRAGSMSCWSPTASARIRTSTTGCATPSTSWPCSPIAAGTREEGQDQGQGRRRDRGEDSDGRPPQRLARLRERGLQLRPGGLPLGALEPAGAAVLVSMTSTARIDEDVAASGAAAIRQGIERYAALQSGSWCRPGCNACEGACPEGIEIAEVLRTRMNAVDYRDQALEDYAKLGAGASACLTCAHRACLGACPYDLPIPTLTRDAATRLG